METHGVASMPEHRRTTRPRTVAAVLAGSNLSLSASVFGWLPVTYGLTWWQVVTATIAGTVLGLLMAAPLALLGYRSGTSSTVASGAFFGVRGRLLSSAIGMVLSLGYVAVAVWTAGEAVVAVTGAGDQPLVHLAIALAVTGLAVFGFDVLTRLNRWLIPVMAVTFTLGMVAFWDDFDVTWTAGPYVMDGAAGTWILALVTAGLSGPVAYVTMLGDFTRYVSPLRHRPRRRSWRPRRPGCSAAWSYRRCSGPSWRSRRGPVTPTSRPWWPPRPAGTRRSSWPGGVLGSLGAAGVPLYNMGLELHGMWPRLSRVAGTVLVAAATALPAVPRPPHDAGRGDRFRGGADRDHGAVGGHRAHRAPALGRLRRPRPPGAPQGRHGRALLVHRRLEPARPAGLARGRGRRPARRRQHLLHRPPGDADRRIRRQLPAGRGAVRRPVRPAVAPQEQEPVPDWRQVYYWPAVRLPDGKAETGERQHAVATLEP